MSVLITGAGGFVGQELAAALLADSQVSSVVLTDIQEPSIPPSVSASHASKATCTAADLSSPAARETLLKTGYDYVYLLHGIMSGASEANLELGLAVNVDTLRAILDTLRTNHKGVRVIFPSTLAVYGPPATPSEVVSEATVPLPQSSYGTAKLITETLLNDYSRRGLIDGRIVRLPTIIVRPGKPTGAASSFASGIIREPLAGVGSILPVSLETSMFVCSPATLVRNLIHARDVPADSFGGLSRTVVLPGITASVAEMLNALEVVGGKDSRKLVEHKVDPDTSRMVATWPAVFDTKRAEGMGFVGDVSLVDNVREYARRYAGK